MVEQLYEVAVERPGAGQPIIHRPVPAILAIRNARMLQSRGFKCHILARNPNRIAYMTVDELEELYDPQTQLWHPSAPRTA